MSTNKQFTIIRRTAAAGVILFCALGVALKAIISTEVTAPTPALLAAGVSAPQFILADQTGRKHVMKDYAHRPIVLAFLDPKSRAYVPSLRSLRDTMPEFDKTGAKVFAVTSATAAETTSVHDQEKLNYPILTDEDAGIARKYGAVDEKGRIRNAAVVIDDTERVVISIPNQETHAGQLGWQLMNVAACCLNPAATPPIVRVGMHVDDFTLPDTRGARISIKPEARWKFTVVEFLSHKCPCALGYDSRMKQLAETYTARGVRFVGINSSVDETAADEDLHIARAGLPFPVFMDNGSVVADNYKASITPEIFVIDSKNIIRYHGRIDDSRDPASVTSQDLKQALDGLLSNSRLTEPEKQAIGCAIMRTKV
jgi:peroxiredoxin